jgi:hypothetical protein
LHETTKKYKLSGEREGEKSSRDKQRSKEDEKN